MPDLLRRLISRPAGEPAELTGDLGERITDQKKCPRRERSCAEARARSLEAQKPAGSDGEADEKKDAVGKLDKPCIAQDDDEIAALCA